MKLSVFSTVAALAVLATVGQAAEPVQISGLYPHLAVTNSGNSEVGIGAVVPWAGKLWLMTYPAHQPKGSDDKLYSVDSQLNLAIRPESVGGTHANRMIHRESKQLIIGPYFIDEQGNVRVVSPKVMPGRLTAVTPHLTDPANKVYFITMEEGVYEVDVKTLEVKTLHLDQNGRKADLLPGAHGKGGYTGQGRLAVANNGKGGCLAEWNGTGDPAKRESWTIVDQNKYTDVTGPAGIYGSPNKDAPLWAIGWDAKSLLLNVCDGGQWTRLRLPRASYTHDADHGWFTEWPRIREASGKRLMTMHGTIHEFPTTFSAKNTAGIRPIASHLRMIVDFTDFAGRLVCASDDGSKFGNALTGRPQSNLWFTSLDGLRELGSPESFGGVWLKEPVKAGKPSEAFWLGGAGSFPYRVVHLMHGESKPVAFTLEVDAKGDGNWTELATLEVAARTDGHRILSPELSAEWIRVKTDRDVKSATAYFHYGSPARKAEPALVASLAQAEPSLAMSEGIIRPTNSADMTLEFAASAVDANGKATQTGYYVIDGDLKLKKVDDAAAEKELRTKAATKQEYEVDDASIIVKEQKARYRLPKGPEVLGKASATGWRRMIREVVTERSLMNVGGTFFELPREESGGMAKIRPICTHNRQIFDFASWRGLLVLSGNLADAQPGEHFVRSEDGKVGLWLGNVDDLWKFGAPRGEGGPWKNSAAKAGEPSDPYLMTGYDEKSVELSHDQAGDVKFTLEVDPTGTGTWVEYQTLTVPAGKTVRHEFPAGYSAHWVRVKADKDCRATAWFVYGPASGS